MRHATFEQRVLDLAQRDERVTQASAGQCAPLTRVVVAVGEPCGEVGDIDAASLASCPDGTFCNHANTSDVTQSCAERVARGAACSSEDLCAEQGDGCLPTESGGSACQPITVVGAAGGPCTLVLGSDLGVCNGLARLVCVDGACVATGSGRDGATCGGTPFAVGCAAAFGCVDGTCRALRANGDGCDGDDQCASGLCDGVCAARCPGA